MSNVYLDKNGRDCSSKFSYIILYFFPIFSTIGTYLRFSQLFLAKLRFKVLILLYYFNNLIFIYGPTIKKNTFLCVFP